MRPAPRPALPRWSRRPHLRDLLASRISIRDTRACLRTRSSPPQCPAMSFPVTGAKPAADRLRSLAHSISPGDGLSASSLWAATTRPQRGYAVRSIEVTAPHLPPGDEPIPARPSRDYCRFQPYLGGTPGCPRRRETDRDAHRPALRPPTRPARLLSELRRVRASGSHRSPWQVPPGTSRGRGPGSVASDQERERKRSQERDAQRRAPRRWPPSSQDFPFGATTLWSFGRSSPRSPSKMTPSSPSSVSVNTCRG
jgi:hypothetical protein